MTIKGCVLFSILLGRFENNGMNGYFKVIVDQLLISNNMWGCRLRKDY